MTISKKGGVEPKRNEELDLQKRTLRDLPSDGADVKGGRGKPKTGTDMSESACPGTLCNPIRPTGG